MARLPKVPKGISINSQAVDQIADWKAFVGAQKDVRFSRVDIDLNEEGAFMVRSAFGVDENNAEVEFSDTIRRLIEGDTADATVHSITG